MFDVVILTDERYVTLQVDDEYNRNVMLEDQLVITELINRGLRVKKVAWSDPHFDWSSTKYALFRTTWDYAERFAEFADWLMEVSIKTRLINSYDIISWNLDKHYLADLERAGVNTVKTHFIEVNDTRTLAEIHKELGWEHTVLKPSISAAAKDTYQLTTADLTSHEAVFKELISQESMMLQPFQKSVMERGELSLMVVAGEYSHAVLKIAKAGDFRVQDDFGGTVHDYEPTTQEIELALKAANAYDSKPLYARVDMIDDNNGNPAISELELMEPEMWFRKKPEAAEKLAKAVVELFH